MADWMEKLFALAQHDYSPKGEQPWPRSITSKHVFRVSDLLIPAPLLVRNWDWKSRPEHPADGIARLIGTAVHERIARNLDELPIHASGFSPGYRMHARVSVQNELYAVTGEPDFYVEESGTLVDLKTCKYGTPMKPEWVWQLRIYAWLWAKENFVKRVRSIGILKLFKNWSPENPRQRGGPWEFEQVEMVSDEAVERFIRYRIGLILKAREGAGDCPPNERWGTMTVRPDGMALVENPKRCQFYCKHRDYCPQWEQEKALGPVPMKPIPFEPPDYPDGESACPNCGLIDDHTATGGNQFGCWSCGGEVTK